MLLPAIVNGAFSPLVKSIMNRAIPSSDRRATILSFESMARRMAFGAFSPLLGQMVKEYTLSTGFFLCAGFGVIGAALLVARPLRAMRAPAPMPTGELPSPTPAASEERAA